MALNTSTIPQIKQISTILTHSGQTASTIKDSTQAITENSYQNTINAGVSVAQLTEAIAAITVKELPFGNLVAPASLVNNVKQINDQLSKKQAVDSNLVYQAFSDISAILASGAFTAAAVAGSPVIAGLGAALVLAAGALTIIAVAQGKDTVNPELQNNLENIYDVIQNYRNGDNGNPLLPPNSIDTRRHNYPTTDPITNWYTNPQNRLPDPSQSNTYRIVLIGGDPLALDLDGDGLETAAASGYAGALFDHNNDGIKTATGWINGDDGLLVRDINGDGIINNGSELFGDSTQLANGTNSANGFAALRDIDSNNDGKVDAADTAFNELKIWRDTNQDGISQADELKTLSETGIESSNTAAANTSISTSAGLQILTGSFTKTDGTTATLADLTFTQDNFHSEYVDHVAIQEALVGAASDGYELCFERRAA